MARIGWIDVSYTQSTTNNTSTITIKGIIQTTGDSYRGDHRTGTYTIKKGSTTIASGSFTHGAPATSTTTLFTKSVTVTHATDGSYGDITATYNYDDGWCTATQTTTIPTIKRASVLGTISSFTLGNTITVPITRYAFTDTLVVSVGGTTIKTVTGLATSSYSLSFTSAELTTIYSKIPNSTSATFTFTLKTMNGTTQVGTSTKTATGTIPSSVKPSISSVIVSEGGSLVPSSWGIYVQSKSKIKFVTSASAGSGASVSSIKVTFNGSTYTGSTVTTNTISTSGTLTATIVVTDSRSRTTSTTKSITIYAYSPPYITTFTALRCNSDGTTNNSGSYVKSAFVGGVTSLNGKNTYSYTYKYKLSSETEWTEETVYVSSTSINENLLRSGFDTSYSYDVIGVVSDYFTSVDSKVTVPSGYMTMSLLAGGTGVAIGKVAETTNCFDVNLNTRHRKHIYIDNDKAIYGTFTDGTNGSIAYINENDNTVLGYGGYLYGIGATNIYGITMNLYSKNTVTINQGITANGTIKASATDTTSRTVTVGNSNGQISLHISTNRGVFDTTANRWMIYTENSSGKTRMPSMLYADGGITSSSNVIIPNQGNGKLLATTTEGETFPLINISTSDNIYIGDSDFEGNVNIYGNKVTYAGTPLIVKPGDSVSTGGFNIGGFVSGSTKVLYFDIPIGKVMCGISSCTVDTMKLNIRKVEGGYIGTDAYTTGGYNFADNSSYTITATPKPNQGVVSIKIERSTAFDTTNNTPIGIEGNSVVLVFA